MRKLITLLALVCCGCSKPLSNDATNNPDYRVEKLFTHEGCTVFRFYAFGNHYYVDCRGQTNSSVTCGRGCRRDEVIPTKTDGVP